MKLTYKNTSPISSTLLEEMLTSNESYRENLMQIVTDSVETAPEASILLPLATDSIKQISELAETFKSESLQTIVVIGIGGSNLGTKAIYDALRPFPSEAVEILFLETVSSAALLSTADQLKKLGNKNAFVIISISKSGGTTETIANTEALLAAVKETYGYVLDRLVVISDEGSKFWNAAIEQGVAKLSLPKMVGGRYSVFSAVGLFPLALAGFNIERLLNGAHDAIEDSISNDPRKNLAMVSANATYTQLQNKRSIHNSFFFAPELESLGKRYRQIMGESVGKEKDRGGKIVHAGITPIVSIGSTDLHSMAQLYFGGPDDKFTNIISAKSTKEVSLPKHFVFSNLVEHLETKSFDTLMQAIVDGVTESYEKLHRPFLSIELDRIDERELGYYLLFRMIEMMYLANLLNVNAFNQPSVELYKEETRKHLAA